MENPNKTINEIIDELWSQKSTSISLPNKELSATLRIEDTSNPSDLFDILLTDIAENKPIGFIVITRSTKGIYQIINYPLSNPHEGFSNTLGWGIEVQPEYQHKGYGYGFALLSLGIGIAQRDYKSRNAKNQFEVIATGISKKAEFYLAYGFDSILYNGKLSGVRYTNPDYVRELQVKT